MATETMPWRQRIEALQKVSTTDAQQQSPTGKITTNSKVCRCEFYLSEISSLNGLLAHKNTEAMKFGVVLHAWVHAWIVSSSALHIMTCMHMWQVSEWLTTWPTQMINWSLTEIITPTQPYLLPPAAAQRIDSLNRAHINAKLHSQTA
jgi:hypothetical protein